MTEFLLELYVSKADCAAVAVEAERLARAAAELGRPVRVVRTLFVPEDETCFVLIEAETADAVRDLAHRAALPFERVVEATVHIDHQAQGEIS